MNCDGVRGLLSAYLDGELSAGELLRVEQHLRRCHACADEVDSLRQTISLVASLDEVEVPASFQVQLHQRLVALGPPAAVRRTPGAPHWQRKVATYAVPAVAAAAALAFSLTQVGGFEELTQGALNKVNQPSGHKTPESTNLGATNVSNPPESTPPKPATPTQGAEPSAPPSSNPEPNPPQTTKPDVDSTPKAVDPAGNTSNDPGHPSTPVGNVSNNPDTGKPVTINTFQPTVVPAGKAPVTRWNYSVVMSAGVSDPQALLRQLAATYGSDVQLAATVKPQSGMIDTLISVPVDSLQATVQALKELGFAQHGEVIKSPLSADYEAAQADLANAEAAYNDHLAQMKLMPSDDAVLMETAKQEEAHLKARLDEASAVWDRISEQAGTAQIIISIQKQGQ